MESNKQSIRRAVITLSLAIIIALSSACASTRIDTADTTADPAPETARVKKSEVKEEYRDITYKTVGDVKLKLDIFSPTVPVREKAPVLFYIHGGSWVSGDRSLEDAGFIGGVIKQIRALGVAVVPVTYRLTTDTVTYPAHINDVCDAIRFAVKNADEYNLDPERIGLIGFSAGGHLSLLAGFCETQFGDDPELADTDFKVKCVIDFCGPADFTQPEDYPVEMQRKYMLELLSGFLGAPFEGGEQLYADASPINYVNQNDDLSLIIFQGKNDELIPCAQVDRLYERCVEEKIDAVYVPVENATHSFNAFDQKKPISPSLKEITEKCIAFIKEKLI